MLVGGYTAFLFEATFLLGVASRRSRTFYLVVGLGLHLGIALHVPDTVVRAGVDGVSSSYWCRRLDTSRSGPHDRVAPRRFGITELSYNGDCSRCRKRFAVVSTLDFLRVVDCRVAEQAGPCTHGVVVRRGTRPEEEVAAVQVAPAVLRALRWTAPLLALWALPAKWRSGVANQLEHAIRGSRTRWLGGLAALGRNRRVADLAIVGALAAWIIALGFVALRVTPIADTTSYKELRQPAHWLYAFTGIREHAVFIRPSLCRIRPAALVMGSSWR